ncbi:germ cell nuclear acidic protein-like isoform X2 [Littorina saxatilis]|uniref:germ cell nuclear acidic protein-like isoform X2 n=1 Tax=Littorina saxatilis TaxID=31220 RepID=UPI0038B4C209
MQAVRYGMQQGIPNIQLSADDLKCPDKRRELSAFYFQTFNRTVFSDKLPPNLAVHWNKRLLTTAGRCLQATIGDQRVAFIHLSNKICDTTDRVRDTLLHEMCHAATWVLDGVQHTDHGKNFQFWAERAHRIHPDLPPINSFHTYIIRKQFNYRCTKCSNRVGRHTDSLDTKKNVCGLCGGRFQLMKESGDSKTSSRTTVHEPSARGDSFARYVRENIRRVKQRNKKLSIQGIMRKLSREFDKIHGR